MLTKKKQLTCDEIGILNPNRAWSYSVVRLIRFIVFLGRHDEPEEQEQDRIREEIKASHRFYSFAEERSENIVKWCARDWSSAILLIRFRHIDGHDYMWAVSEMLLSATEAIFILV